MMLVAHPKKRLLLFNDCKQESTRGTDWKNRWDLLGRSSPYWMSIVGGLGPTFMCQPSGPIRTREKFAVLFLYLASCRIGGCYLWVLERLTNLIWVTKFQWYLLVLSQHRFMNFICIYIYVCVLFHQPTDINYFGSIQNLYKRFGFQSYIPILLSLCKLVNYISIKKYWSV